MNWLQRLLTSYQIASERVLRVIFLRALPRAAGNRIEILKCLRILGSVILPVSFLLFVGGLLTLTQWACEAGALLLGVAGTIQILRAEEMDAAVELYAEQDYPFGPPSYVTRELIAGESPDIFLEEETEEFADHRHIGQHYYDRRGVVLILFGFVFQFVTIFVPS